MSESAGFFYPNDLNEESSPNIRTSSMADEEEETIDYDPFESFKEKRKGSIPSGDRVNGQYVSYTTFEPMHDEFISDNPVDHYNRNHPPYAPGKLSDDDVRSLYEWQRERMENIKRLRESPEYKFFELVAGTMSRYPSDILGSSHDNHQKAYASVTGSRDVGGSIPTFYPTVPPTPFSESAITSVKGNIPSGAPTIADDFIPKPVRPKDFRDDRIRNDYEGRLYTSVVQHSQEKGVEKEKERRRNLMLTEKKRLDNLIQSGIINQNPAIYQATLQAKMLLDTRAPRLSGALVDKHYIRCKDQTIVSQFANLVGNVALKAGTKNPTRWHLNSTYTRIEMEIERIVRWFQSNVNFNGATLFFTPGSFAPKGADGIASMYKRRNKFPNYYGNSFGSVMMNARNPVHDLDE